MLIKFRRSLFWFNLRFKLRSALKKFGFGVLARALDLQACLFWKLKYQLRLLGDASRSEGFDPDFDKIVHLAALRLAAPATFDENVYKLLYDDHSHSLASPDEDTRLRSAYEKYKKTMNQLVAGNKRHRLDYEEHKEAVDQLVASHGGGQQLLQRP